MEQYPRVNGVHIGRMAGQNVTFVGEVIQADASRALLKAPDGIEVTVNLPVGEQLESQFIQVVGKVSGANRIDAFLVKSMNVPSECNGVAFDMNMYNQALELVTGTYKHLFE